MALSQYSLANTEEIEAICHRLELADTFWAPGALDANDRSSWFHAYGSYNISVPLVPEAIAPVDISVEEEYVVGRESENSDDGSINGSITEIKLRTFDSTTMGIDQGEPRDRDGTIVSSYNASLAGERHRLHNLMVVYIAQICASNGAEVYDDPNTVDLLVLFSNSEFLVEVKTVTPRNFVNRLRLALGQVLQYDYLRALQTSFSRRKVIAVTTKVPQDAWCVPFLNTYMDTDLLSLENQMLRVNSLSPLAQQLFASNHMQGTLGN
ncbi:MAG: hypothetical protein ACRYFS_08545 [Janthinobacterium lividum]